MSGPTREQVRAALADPWHETGRVEVLTLERMTDAVMALLAAPVVAGEPESTPAADLPGEQRHHLLCDVPNAGSCFQPTCRCECHHARHPGAADTQEAHDAH